MMDSFCILQRGVISSTYTCYENLQSSCRCGSIVRPLGHPLSMLLTSLLKRSGPAIANMGRWPSVTCASSIPSGCAAARLLMSHWSAAPTFSPSPIWPTLSRWCGRANRTDYEGRHPSPASRDSRADCAAGANHDAAGRTAENAIRHVVLGRIFYAPILALRQRRRLRQPLPEALREGGVVFVSRLRAFVHARELFQVGKRFRCIDAAEFVEIIG